MDKQAKIVCAAVRFTAGCFTETTMCLKHDDEFFMNGLDGVRMIFPKKKIKSENGFMTSTGRFVDPIEAQQIAIACGQYRDPHIRIKSLEKSIEVGWDSVKYAKTSVMITSLKKQISEDQAALDELKAGYLGNALRVEDLHYVQDN